MNRTVRRRTATRRISALLALVGALLMSSGFAVMASAGAANATKPDPEHQVWVCHATGSDSNPYQAIHVDVASTTYQGHLQHRNDPNKTWQQDGWWNGVFHTAGSAKADLIEDLDGNITEAYCLADSEGLRPATASVDWTEPNCANEGVGSWTTTASHATWDKATGTADPEEAVTLTATAAQGYEFAGGSATTTAQHTFASFDPEACGEVEGPVVVTPDITLTQPSCDNDGTAAWEGVNGAQITYSLKEGTPGPGATIKVEATPKQGFAFEGDAQSVVITKTFDAFDPEQCQVSPPEAVTPQEPTFVEPTCADPEGDVTLPEPQVSERRDRAAAGPTVKSGIVDGVLYTVTGSTAPGGTVDVDATATDGFVLAEGATTHWSHTFASLSECGQVEPPTVIPPESGTEAASASTSAGQPATTTTTIPTVVHAGLASGPADLGSSRSVQGLALVLAGALALVAGGLGMRRRGELARI